MILGIDALTFVHVVLSLVGIGAGLVTARAMAAGAPPDAWADTFLVTTALTSITGFLFPFSKLLPSHIVGIISLIALAPAFYARYATALAGSWRPTYAITAMIALYLNVFVLVAQLFQKIPALQALAPTQAEPPFAIAQVLVLAAVIVLGWRAVRGFRGLAMAKD